MTSQDEDEAIRMEAKEDQRQTALDTAMNACHLCGRMGIPLQTDTCEGCL